MRRPLDERDLQDLQTGLLGVGRCGGLLKALEEAENRVGRLRSPTAPELETVVLHGEKPGFLRGIEGADVLQEATPTGAAVVGHHQTIEGTLLCASAGETNVNGHEPLS